MNTKKYIALITSALILVSVMLNSDYILQFIYPIHYEEYVYKYSKEFEIDPYLVFAIMKTESKYFPYAKSYKNAKGLMQIGDSTKEWAIQELELKKCDLFNPEDNIMIGCWYIRKLFNEFDNVDLVIAAYNGGSGNVGKWLKNKEYSQNGISLNNIPFKETDEYVEKVEKSYSIYKAIYEKRDKK